MRLAYIVSTLNQCGPVNVLYDIVANLRGANEITVFTLASEPEGSRAGDFKELGITVKRVVESRCQSLLFGKQALRRALKVFRPDIVHAHGFRATLLCQNLPYPKVVTVHNCIYEDYLTTYGRVRASWMTRAEVVALKKFDEIVACSESNAEYLRDKFGLTVSTVRNGVDQSKFYPLAVASRDRLRAELGIKPGVFMLVATGGCSERKGTLPIVKAFFLAQQKTGADAEFHVFGEGPDYGKCKSLGLARVYFHGFVSNVTPWLQISDLFVSASASEGMPLAVLEAISCGLPALLSDIAPHREILGAVREQNCIACFNAHSDKYVVEALEEILMGKVLERPRDVDCFSSRVMARAYAGLYDRCSCLVEKEIGLEGLAR